VKKTTKKLGLFLIFSMLLCICLTSCGSTKGFDWTVNQQEKTITVEGIGKLPEINENKYPDSKYGDYTLIFGDGITGVEADPGGISVSADRSVTPFISPGGGY